MAIKSTDEKILVPDEEPVQKRAKYHVQNAILVVVILLSVISCGLMLMEDFHSLDVGSVYQQF